MKKAKKVVITGALGQIAYSLLFRILSGEFLGKDQPIELALVDLESLAPQFPGLLMEIEDVASEVLTSVQYGSDPEVLFKDADYIFLVGAKPRGPGMERKDLLAENGSIFQRQGRVINDVASRDVKVLVVGNPCNTNCLIALKNAPDLSPLSFASMSSLDEMRAKALLAKELQTVPSNLSPIAVWGNHSATQVPDAFSTYLLRGHKKVSELLPQEWLSSDFLSRIQQRGAEVIKARGKSSAASAANAALVAMKSWIEGDVYSSFITSFGRYSSKNPYGIDQDLVFSFPCHSVQGELLYAADRWKTIPELLKEKVRLTEKELIDERDMVRHLLP